MTVSFTSHICIVLYSTKGKNKEGNTQSIVITSRSGGDVFHYSFLWLQGRLNGDRLEAFSLSFNEMDFPKRDVSIRQVLFTGNKALTHCRTFLLIFKPNEGLRLAHTERGQASRCVARTRGGTASCRFLPRFLLAFSLASPIAPTLDSGDVVGNTLSFNTTRPPRPLGCPIA